MSQLNGLITRGWRRSAVVGLAVATVMTVMATPAQATILDRDRYEFTYSDVYDDFCDFDIHVEATVRGQFHVRQGKGPNAPVLFTHRRESWEETWTANGITITFSAHATFVRTRAIDIGDGIFLIHRIQAGRGWFEDASGTVLLREAGAWQVSFLWDTTTNEFVDLVSLEMRGLWPEADLCAFFE